jgi:cardiolipin synthase
VFAALERLHKRGVEVRALLDHLGSRPFPEFKNTRKWFTEIGIEYHLILPLRSFHLNLEVTLICYDAQVVADLRPIEENYIRKSKQLHLREWKTRSASNIFFENIARLTSALQ